MSTESERIQILEMVAAGQISAAEGVKLIQALDSIPESVASDGAGELPAGTASPEAQWNAAPPPAAEPYSAPVEEPLPPQPESAPFQPQPGIRKWRNWWQIPLWIGVIITVFSAILMYLAWQAQQFSFLFVCSWFPFLIGVAVLALAWASHSARWLHVRVHQKPGERPQTIAISLPIPIRLTAWFLRIFRGRISGLEKINLDEMLLALENVSPEAPLYVSVDDDDDGEKVEVYIG